MQILYAKRFDKAFAKLEKKKQEKVFQAISIFQENPYCVTLKNYKLSGDKTRI